MNSGGGNPGLGEYISHPLYKLCHRVLPINGGSSDLSEVFTAHSNPLALWVCEDEGQEGDGLTWPFQRQAGTGAAPIPWGRGRFLLPPSAGLNTGNSDSVGCVAALLKAVLQFWHPCSFPLSSSSFHYATGWSCLLLFLMVNCWHVRTAQLYSSEGAGCSFPCCGFGLVFGKSPLLPPKYPCFSKLDSWISPSAKCVLQSWRNTWKQLQDTRISACPFDTEVSKGRARENELNGSKTSRQTARGPNFVLLKSQGFELPPLGLLIAREDCSANSLWLALHLTQVRSFAVPLCAGRFASCKQVGFTLQQKVMLFPCKLESRP